MTAPVPKTIDITAAPYLASNGGSVNVTDKFIAACADLCAAGGGVLLIPPGTYLVGEQLFAGQTGLGYAYQGKDVITISGCSTPVLIQGEGATLRLASGLKLGSFDPVTGAAHTPTSLPFNDPDYAASVGRIIVVSNNSASVTVHGLTLDGNSANLTLGGEWGEGGRPLAADGIDASANAELVLTQLNLHHHGRDGMRLSHNASTSATPRTPVSLRKMRSEYNGRHGLAWLGGNGLSAVDCAFNHSGRGALNTAPAHGVMVTATSGSVRNGHFLNCEWLNNSDVGLNVASGDVADLTLQSCTMVGTTHAPLAIAAPRVHLLESVIAGQTSTVYPAQSAGDGNATRFSACRLTDQHTYQSQVYMPAGGYLLNWGNASQGVQLDRCAVETGIGVLGQTNGMIQTSNCRFRQTIAGASAIQAVFHGDSIFDTSGSNDLSSSVVLGRMLFNGTEVLQYDQVQRRLRFYANTGNGGRAQNVGFCYSATAFASAYGAANVGDIVYNTAPSPGGYIGWVCTAAGNPGTWKRFGVIAS